MIITRVPHPWAIANRLAQEAHSAWSYEYRALNGMPQPPAATITYLVPLLERARMAEMLDTVGPCL